MKKILFFFAVLTFMSSCKKDSSLDIDINPLLEVAFSVSDNRCVVFAEGNLQYQKSTDTWRFAENPWDFIGEDNKYISAYQYSGWIDLFGWGTGDFPTKNSPDDRDYGVFSDWGNYCKLPTPEGSVRNWRTLSSGEWDYVMFKRNTLSGARFAKAQLNEVNGIILMPDMWYDSIYPLNNKNNNTADFAGNIISASTWRSVFEPEGCVFIPVTGSRQNSTVFNIGSDGFYWSSSQGGTYYADCFYFHSKYCFLGSRSWHFGNAVRLTVDVRN